MAEDNLEPLVTQCPNCDTRFRVSESQLQIAQGRVRCGACLGVFDGTAHLSLDGEELAHEDEAADVDALLEELDEISGQDNVQDASLPDVADQDLLATRASEMPSGAAGKNTDDAAAAEENLLAGRGGLPDELLALEAQLLDELREAQEDDDDSFTDQVVGDDTDTAGSEEPSRTEPLHDLGSDDVDEIEVSDDAEPLQGIELPARAEGEQQAVPDGPHQDKAEGVEQEISTTSELEQPESGPAQKPAFAPAAAEDLHLSALYAELEEAEAPETRRSWATLLLILVALIGIPAQVLWFQYDSWVKDPQIRPIYQALCNIAECELPPMRDIRQIVSRKSIIRTHPDRADARIVDVLMVNNADFAQPFPMIELMATTMRGQLVAGRRFKPEEYLQGEMKPADLFPPRTPIHVSLEIQDPGEDALNFEVRFR